jgi:glycosyltransferase involved in cell wall biosynthesis
LKITYLYQYFGTPAGSWSTRVYELTKRWVEAGHEVTVITAPYPKSDIKTNKFTDTQYFDGIKVIIINSGDNNLLPTWRRALRAIVFALTSTIIHLRTKSDITVASSGPITIGIPALIGTILARKKYVFEVRDLWPESAIDTGILNNSLLINLSYKLEKYLYKKAALINVLTPAFQQNLIDKKNIDPKKIIYIPNAADFNLSDTLVQNFDAISFRIRNNTDNKFVITYVGAHGVANHLIQVIDVAEKLRHTNIIFQLIGEGMQKSMLKEEVERRKIDNVIFIDAVPKYNVFEYILASDIGMSVLKKNDTFKTVFSNKTFDYMACKKPILMLIDGVSRELIEEAQCGIYAEPENISEIVEKIKVYYEDTNLLYLHGNNGYNFAKEKFDRIKLAKNYLDNLVAIK